MDYLKVTKAYYSHWLGVDIDSVRKHDVLFTYSEICNSAQAGYSRPFDLFLFKTEDRLIISYGNKACENISSLQSAVSCLSSVEDIQDKAVEIFQTQPAHAVKYLFIRPPVIQTNAISLTTDDYDDYLDFFRHQHPDCRDADWVYDCFIENIKRAGLFAIKADGKIVSCASAPMMPFLIDMVQEIGADTLPEYRRKGYSTAACAACVEAILKSGKCPLWSTSIDNKASQKLAVKIGFAKFADVLSVTM